MIRKTVAIVTAIFVVGCNDDSNHKDVLTDTADIIRCPEVPDCGPYCVYMPGEDGPPTHIMECFPGTDGCSRLFVHKCPYACGEFGPENAVSCTPEPSVAVPQKLESETNLLSWCVYDPFERPFCPVVLVDKGKNPYDGWIESSWPAPLNAIEMSGPSVGGSYVWGIRVTFCDDRLTTSCPCEGTSYTPNASVEGATCKFSEEVSSCRLAPWDAWSECSASCGGGIKTKSREVITEPSKGGATCPPLVETGECNNLDCGDTDTTSDTDSVTSLQLPGTDAIQIDSDTDTTLETDSVTILQPATDAIQIDSETEDTDDTAVGISGSSQTFQCTAIPDCGPYCVSISNEDGPATHIVECVVDNNGCQQLVLKACEYACIDPESSEGPKCSSGPMVAIADDLESEINNMSWCVYDPLERPFCPVVLVDKGENPYDGWIEGSWPAPLNAIERSAPSVGGSYVWGIKVTFCDDRFTTSCPCEGTNYTPNASVDGATCKFSDEVSSCRLAPWDAWSECTASCGGGIKTKSREVITEPSNGGAGCPSSIETMECNMHECIDTETFLDSESDSDSDS